MLVRGRRLDPRRITRYLFQELLAPWIQFKRVCLRIEWFFTKPIHIGPLWTGSVIAGLIGVMLTIMLFKPPGRLQAAVVKTPAVPQQFVPSFPILYPPPAVPMVSVSYVPLDAELIRMTLPALWDQARQQTLVSHSLDSMGHVSRNVLPAIRDGWEITQRTLELAANQYRFSAPRWNPVAFVPPAVASDQPAAYDQGTASPSVEISRDLPTETPPGAPVSYSIVVKNSGREILEKLLVTETVSNLERVESVFPPAEVSTDSLYWKIDSLRPGQEKRLAVTLSPIVEPEFQTSAEVRAAVAVSSTTLVKPAIPQSKPIAVDEPPPNLLVLPRVEPASREEPKFPRLSVIAEIPNSLTLGDELSTVFVVSNTGTGDADDVVLTVAVPAELQHRDGAIVEHRYAQIPAGTTKRAMFKALAKGMGPSRIAAKLTSRGDNAADWTATMQIVARAPSATPGPSPSIAAPFNAPGGGSNPNPAGSSIPRSRTNPGPPSTPLNSIPGGQPPTGGLIIPPGNVRPIRPNTGVTPPQFDGPAGAPSFSPAAPNGAPGTPNPPAGIQKSGPDEPEDHTFVSIPRRAGAGGVSGWKRAVNR